MPCWRNIKENSGFGMELSKKKRVGEKNWVGMVLESGHISFIDDATEHEIPF